MLHFQCHFYFHCRYPDFWFSPINTHSLISVNHQQKINSSVNIGHCRAQPEHSWGTSIILRKNLWWRKNFLHSVFYIVSSSLIGFSQLLLLKKLALREILLMFVQTMSILSSFAALVLSIFHLLIFLKKPLKLKGWNLIFQVQL